LLLRYYSGLHIEHKEVAMITVISERNNYSLCTRILYEKLLLRFFNSFVRFWEMEFDRALP
jgi:hypothetical protein